MPVSHELKRIFAFGLAYGVAAAISIGMSRMDGGFAMFWMATALLVPWLLPRRPRRWWPILVVAAVASSLVTGLFGLGWRAAPFLAAANCVEAVVDAYLIRWVYHRIRSVTSLGATSLTYLVGGVVGPLAAAGPAMLGINIARHGAMWSDLGFWMLAHGLGFVALFPCTGLIARARVNRRSILPPPGNRLDAALALVALLAAGAICFGQSVMPMMFLPILVLMYTMALTDLIVSAFGLILIITLGVGAAFFDMGPFRIFSEEPAEKYLYLNFYVACVSLTAMPIAILLEKRRKLFADLAESETRYRMLADFSTDIIMVTGLQGEIRYVSPSIHQLGDWDPHELAGTTTNALVAPQHHVDVAKAHIAVIRNPGTTATVEFLGVTRGQGMRWFESHLRAILREDGAVDGVCSVVRDISKRKRTEAELTSVALTDPLTTLANRRAFELFMGSERPAGESFIAMFDLDNFKRVNDTFGHQAGDDVLKCFARAARSALRDTDLAARLGGEEFVIHLHNSSLAQAQIICERVRVALGEEVDRRLPGVGPVTASVGLSRFDAPLAVVLRRANTALYEAKSAGRDGRAIAA